MYGTLFQSIVLINKSTKLTPQKRGGGIFVIGATNRPDLLDKALLRPGRFDRLIYLGICTNKDEQLKIVQALSRKFTHEAGLLLSGVVAKCPLNFTGADFYGLCSGAMGNALSRRVADIQAELALREVKITPRKYLADLSEEELDVKVGMVDYEKALATLVPSVSQDEIAHYHQLREEFSSSA